MPEVPLHADAPADPTRRRTVVSCFDFHAAIQVHGALTVLVIAEGLDWQRKQGRPLFGEHGRDLSLGGAMDARVGPACFPVVQIGLRLLRAFEAHALQRRLLRMPDAALDLPLIASHQMQIVWGPLWADSGSPILSIRSAVQSTCWLPGN